MRIALGTVQFGLDYGVSNTSGKTTPDEVCRILQQARASGIDTLDTAYQYGDSEAVIGSLSELTDGLRIITKTRSFHCQVINNEHLDSLDHGFEESLKRLRRQSVEGLLIHDVRDLFAQNGERLYARLCHYRDTGRVKKIGVSLYTPEQAMHVLRNYDIDIVQIPLNLMDRRMLNTGLLERFKRSSVEIHVRSAFLQGLFFMAPEAISETLSDARPFIVVIQERARTYGVSVGVLALGFLQDIPEIDRIVIGVNTAEQLVTNLRDYEQACKALFNFDDLACEDINIIDPTCWR